MGEADDDEELNAEERDGLQEEADKQLLRWNERGTHIGWVDFRRISPAEYACLTGSIDSRRIGSFDEVGKDGKSVHGECDTKQCAEQGIVCQLLYMLVIRDVDGMCRLRLVLRTLLYDSLCREGL